MKIKACQFIRQRLIAMGPSITVGERLPAIVLTALDRNNSLIRFDGHAFFRNRKIALFTAPKAPFPLYSTDDLVGFMNAANRFDRALVKATITSKHHFFGFVKAADQLKKMGMNDIACAAVNRVDEMQTWQRMQDPQKKIQMIPDVNGDFTFDMGLAASSSQTLGAIARHTSMIVEDGVVTWMLTDEDTCVSSHASECLNWLRKGAHQ